MRGIIAALRDAANPFSILTKGTLILRDLDLLLEAAEVTEVGLNVSAGFVDKSLWRAIEPGTPAPERRLEACAALNDAGLRCGVLMGPVVPYLSDSPAQLDGGGPADRGGGRGARHADRAAPAARRPRVVPAAGCGAAHPELVPRYAELYGRGAYARKDYQATDHRPGPRAGRQSAWAGRGPRRRGASRGAAPAPGRGPSSFPCGRGLRDASSGPSAAHRRNGPCASAARALTGRDAHWAACG